MLRLVRARPTFHMISRKLNSSLGIVDCSICTRSVALKDEYHKKRMDMLSYTPLVLNYLETLAKTFLIQSVQTKRFHPGRRFQQCSGSSDCFCIE